MGRVCGEVHEWVERRVERRVEEWIEDRRRRCRRRPWWDPRRWFCEIITTLIRIVYTIIVVVGMWVVRVVCEVVNATLDFAAFMVNLILSIPLIGGILRTILNWLTEIFWRLVGIIDFFLSVAGVHIRKRMYVQLIILNSDGNPLDTEANVLPAIEAARIIFDDLCNINLFYMGSCSPKETTPRSALSIRCGVHGFFEDWTLTGSYFEFTTATCSFQDGWRRVLGFGAPIIVFVIRNVRPDSATQITTGCSAGPTHNYVVVDPGPGPVLYSSIAHEIGHACGLWHVNQASNLMNPTAPPPPPAVNRLTPVQIAWIRSSRHCTFI